NNSDIYLYIGKTTEWDSNELDIGFVVPSVNVSEIELKNELKEIVSLNKVSASDVSIGIKRYNWTYGDIYDPYDSYDENLLRKFQYPETNPFYIMTDEYNVYKCLNNNNSSISTEKPTGQFLIPFETSDGYLWKFMFNVPEEHRVKFLSSDFIPLYSNSDLPLVSSQTTVKNAAKNGSIEWVEIIDGGLNYVDGQVSITVSGDGTNAAFTPVLGTSGEITSITIDNSGEDYTEITLTIVDNTTTATPATIRAHISPQGGHGYNCVNELGGFFTIISVDLITDENSFFPTDISYRKTGLITDLIDLDGNEANALRYYGPLNDEYSNTSLKTSNPEQFIKEDIGSILYINNHIPVFRSATQLERAKLVLENL
ncbi:MAG: hypothetical protein KC589_05715, partial [Nanoarchaeota archaeon]|nr:hypothetical protein [Nanoarchaeota archaeon]